MSVCWLDIPEAIRQIAESSLTRKQLVAYQLSSNGLSEQRLAVYLGISRRAVRDRLHAADVKIRAHPDYPRSEAA